MIGNGQNIKCTQKGLLDVICVQNDGSTARETWEIKLVLQLNHDLFSFMSPMKEGLQMNGRWKKHGIEIELFQKGHEIFSQDDPFRIILAAWSMSEMSPWTSPCNHRSREKILYE